MWFFRAVHPQAKKALLCHFSQTQFVWNSLTKLALNDVGCQSFTSPGQTGSLLKNEEKTADKVGLHGILVFLGQGE
jgi:hypothetical protein